MVCVRVREREFVRLKDCVCIQFLYFHLCEDLIYNILPSPILSPLQDDPFDKAKLQCKAKKKVQLNQINVYNQNRKSEHYLSQRKP